MLSNGNFEYGDSSEHRAGEGRGLQQATTMLILSFTDPKQAPFCILNDAMTYDLTHRESW